MRSRSRSSRKSNRTVAFYPAENYHQDFLTRNPKYPYIVVNDLPKVEDLKRFFAELYRTSPVLVSGAQSSQ